MTDDVDEPVYTTATAATTLPDALLQQVVSEDEEENDRYILDPLDLDRTSAQLEPEDDWFTQDELAAALRGLDPSQDLLCPPDSSWQSDEASDEDLPDQDQELPEIDILDLAYDGDFLASNGGEFSLDKSLFEPLQDLDYGFDHGSIDSPRNCHTSEESLIPTSDVGAPDCNKSNAIELLEQLESLTLDYHQDTEREENFEEIDNNEISLEQELPPWLFCQPCNSNSSDLEALEPLLTASTENYVERNRYDEQALDSLLDLRGLTLEDYSEYCLPQGDLEQLDTEEPTRKMLPSLSDNATSVTTGVDIRPDVQRLAQPILQTFDAIYESEPSKAETTGTVAKQSTAKPPRSERLCLGHKERILGLDLSPCGQYLATASQDSTVRVWSTDTNQLLATVPHNSAYECLRVVWASPQWAENNIDRNGCACPYLLATGGADGIVRLFRSEKPTEWVLCATLDHAEMNHFEGEEEADTPQVYALQFIDHWKALPGSKESDTNSFLLTSSDDHVHLWEICSKSEGKKEESDNDSGESGNLRLREVFSMHFGDMHNQAYGVQVGHVTAAGLDIADATTSPIPISSGGDSGVFGGDRNPRGLVYVFDARYCEANGLLGAALSDGTLRLVNGRGVCLSLLQLPGHRSHLTSLAWDRTGECLATCVATGHLITWGVSVDENANRVHATCRAVMEGGHDKGRPLFGTEFVGRDGDEEDDLLISWGVDGRLCLWDSFSTDEIDRPLAVLLHKPEYPIYAVDLMQDAFIAVGGGTGDGGGFVGIPVHLYKFPPKEKASPDTLSKDRDQL